MLGRSVVCLRSLRCLRGVDVVFAGAVAATLTLAVAPREARADGPPAASAESAAPAGGATGAAPAAPVARDEDPTLRKTAPERRAGLVVGLAPGVAFVGASGYPNNVTLIGNPDYYSESPLLVGSSTTLFVMGALADYLNFGPMVNVSRSETSSWKSTSLGIGFRVEVFPLVRLFPILADTAIYAQGGVGTTELQAKGPFPSADGTQSYGAVGLHHEFRFFRMLGGHLSGGPYVEYDAVFTSPAERHWLATGFRLAFYGGTVTADAR